MFGGLCHRVPVRFNDSSLRPVLAVMSTVAVRMWLVVIVGLCVVSAAAWIWLRSALAVLLFAGAVLAGWEVLDAARPLFDAAVGR